MATSATALDERPVAQGDPDEGAPGEGGLLSGVLSTVITDLDPSRVSGEDATALYRVPVALERRCQAGKTLLAPPDL